MTWCAYFRAILFLTLISGIEVGDGAMGLCCYHIDLFFFRHIWIICHIHPENVGFCNQEQGLAQEGKTVKEFAVRKHECEEAPDSPVSEINSTEINSFPERKFSQSAVDHHARDSILETSS